MNRQQISSTQQNRHSIRILSSTDIFTYRDVGANELGLGFQHSLQFLLAESREDTNEDFQLKRNDTTPQKRT